jgi:hypothetical protein
MGYANKRLAVGSGRSGRRGYTVTGRRREQLGEGEAWGGVVYGESKERKDADQQKRPRRVVTLRAGVGGGDTAMAAARLCVCRLFFLVADLLS